MASVGAPRFATLSMTRVASLRWSSESFTFPITGTRLRYSLRLISLALRKVEVMFFDVAGDKVTDGHCVSGATGIVASLNGPLGL